MFCRKAAGVTGVKQNTHHFFNGQIAVAYRHGIQLAVCDRDARTAGVFRKHAVFAVHGRNVRTEHGKALHRVLLIIKEIAGIKATAQTGHMLHKPHELIGTGVRRRKVIELLHDNRDAVLFRFRCKLR